MTLQSYLNSDCQWNIILVYDISYSSLAAVTRAKYKSDTNDLIYSLAKLNMSLSIFEQSLSTTI